MTAVLRDHSARTPDKVALRDLSRSLTYAQANDAAHSFANGLSSLGLAHQEAIAVMLDNHLDFAVAWMGISVGPQYEVPVNTAFRGAMLAYVIASSHARTLIIEDEYCSRIGEIDDQVPLLAIVVVRGGDGRDLPDRMRRLSYDEIAAAPPDPLDAPPVWERTGVLYTSGTTGPSKGVVVPHGHAFASAALLPPTEPDDVTMVTMPLFHVGGRWASTYNALIAGATAVIVPVFSASAFWDQVDRFGCTKTVLVGAMADFLLQRPARADDGDHSLRKATIVPSHPTVLDFCKRFQVEASTLYGSTEVGSIMIANVEGDGPRACGRPRADIEVRLVGENDVEVERGEPGELLVRPREPWTLMGGYHNMGDETVVAWRNMWFHTGDTLYQDENGLFYFADRIKDAVRRRGENVSTFEVESHIQLRPEVAQVAVVGVPSEHTEDEIKATIVLVPGHDLDPEELIFDLATRMPYFMVPRYVEFVDELPLTPTQKIQKSILKARGITDQTWDREEMGVSVTRHGVARKLTR